MNTSAVILLLLCACGVDAEPSDTFSESGPTTGPLGENSLLCAPIVEVEGDTGETGGELPFPPEDEQPVLYTCAGDVEVDFYGRVCICGGGNGPGEDKECFYDIAVRPTDQATSEDIGVPSPTFSSSTEMYPEPEIGACCLQVGPNADEEQLEQALDLVCEADCGARACKAAAEELAAIVDDAACWWETFDPDNCHLSLGEGCVGEDYDKCGLPLPGCRQAQIVGATRSDILNVIMILQTPEGFQQCQSNIVNEAGWRPCLPSYSDCLDWDVNNGRFVDLSIFANCSAVEPVRFEDEGAPEPVFCDMNQHANPGASLPGEGFGGFLTGGSLALSTPLGDKSVGIVGSNIGFRRLPGESESCPFILSELEIEADDFSLGPLTVSGLRAQLVNPAVGIVRGDATATIDERAVLMEARFGVAVDKGPKWLTPLLNGKALVFRATNDEPIALIIDDEDNVAIADASFVFPSSVMANMQTDSVKCAPEVP